MLVASDTFGTPGGTAVIPTIGGESPTYGTSCSSWGSFNGTIDELIIYNRTLTPAEITALYQNAPHFSGETWNCTVNATDAA